MNTLFHTCILGLLYVATADVSLRKGHLQVHQSGVTSHLKGQREPRLDLKPPSEPRYCTDPHCETCMMDDIHPEKDHCTQCSLGFGLKHEPKECDNLLNCANYCVPCEVKGCKQCSSLASSCDVCDDKLSLAGGKCTAGSNWDWNMDWFPTPVSNQPSSEAAKRAGEETVKGGKTVYNANPAAANPLVPFQALGVGSVLLAAVLYFVLVFAVAYCYMQQKAPRLAAVSGYLPEDGFSDAICECGQSWSVCMWACCCPCIRWSDTTSQMNFLSFYLSVLIWCCLMLCNAMFTGVGFLLIVVLGAWHRGKIRASFGLPRSFMTGFQDVIAWLCCQPCAIAQEARHVERALGIRATSAR